MKESLCHRRVSYALPFSVLPIHSLCINMMLFITTIHFATQTPFTLPPKYHSLHHTNAIHFSTQTPFTLPQTPFTLPQTHPQRLTALYYFTTLLQIHVLRRESIEQLWKMSSSTLPSSLDLAAMFGSGDTPPPHTHTNTQTHTHTHTHTHILLYVFTRANSRM
jgi:hypothetical protein